MEWKVISKAPDYEVSRSGDVRRIGKRKLKIDMWMGYARVELRIDGKRKKFRVHRIVAEAFIPNFSENCVVDHINRDRLNNSVENLRVTTPIKNSQNKIAKIGLVKHIVELHEQGYSLDRIISTLS